MRHVPDFPNAGYAHNPNSKHEYRNPKQIQMTKISITKTQENIFVLNLEHSNFDIVSYFVFQILDLLTIANNILVFYRSFSCLRCPTSALLSANIVLRR